MTRSGGRPSRPPGPRLAALAIALVAAAALAAPARGEAFRPPSIAPPVMRIGLTTQEGRVVTLAAAGGLRLVEKDSGDPPWRRTFEGDVRVVLLGAGDARTLYRVQVGSLADEAAARALARRLEGDLGVPVRVHHDAQRRLYRVRAGEFAERLAAADLSRRLVDLGYADAWIASEVTGDDSKASLRLVDRDYNEKEIGRRRLAAFAARGGPVKVNGKGYRGVVEIFVDAAGRLRLVNAVNLEEYLRGVVPDEMGPGVYPQIEALKAQAVAARTYAVRNRGQYADEGYDICDSPRCQVYGGSDSEHSLTDRAIAETAGEVLTHGGRLANTLFTSTCGGHTEDVINVFPEQDEPYLKGVRCAPEAEAREQVVTYLRGADLPLLLAAAPSQARWIARLHVMGIVPSADLALEPRQEADGARWGAWRDAAAPWLGRPRPAGGVAAGAITRGALARDVVALMGWEERLERLVPDGDTAVLLGLAPGAPVPAQVAAAGGPEAALLVREGLLEPPPAPGEAAWAARVSHLEALSCLGRLAERLGRNPLAEVRVVGAGPGGLRTEKRGEIPLAPAPLLFAATPSGPAPVGRLALTRHEPVLIHLDGQGRLDYLEAIRPFRSLSDDRFSTRASWEVQVSRDELSSRLSRVLSFGELQDLRVVRRGVSGRVAELEVVGSQGTARLVGFNVRVALRLDETLFTIERQRDPQGRITGFVFAGRGWGHGVGLCQVGAFGMAVRGADHRAILARYYTGARLEKLAGRPDLLAGPGDPPAP